MKEEMNKITSNYSKSMQDMWDDYVKYIDDVKELCDNTPIKVKKKRTAGNTLRIEIPDAKYKLCDIYEETAAWIKWSVEVATEVANIPIKTVGVLCKALGESIEYVLSIIEKGVEYTANWLVKKLNNLNVNNKWVKKIIKKLKLILSHTKKAMLYGKLYILKASKKVLTFAANNKVTKALQKAFVAVVNSMDIIKKIIEAILKMIEGLLSSLVGFTLDGGCMGFFPTPKSMVSGFFPPSNGTMKPANANQDIYTNIADALISPLEEVVRNIALSSTQAKNKAIQTEIETNKALIVNNDDIIDIPDSTIKLEETIDLSKLKALIVLMLSTLFTPEPLPKYERLHPGNLGYMTWLLTSFEPTMKKCFGIPSYP